MIIADEEAMHRLGVQIADGLRAGNLVTLSGTLGAGKTVLAKAIIGPESEVDKEYVVTVAGKVTREKVQKLRHSQSPN